MDIRVEDKKVIQALALMGAVSGVLVALLSVLTDRAEALQTLREERAYVREHEPLLALTGDELASEQRQLPPEVLQASKVEILEHKARLQDFENGFWPRLSPAGLVGVCVGVSLIGASLGFSMFWGLGWTLTLLAFMGIRALYAAGRRIVPRRIDGDHTGRPLGKHSRNEHRIVPNLIRWAIFLMAMAMLVFLLLIQDILPLPAWLHIR